jgi:hypothetical protein
MRGDRAVGAYAVAGGSAADAQGVHAAACHGIDRTEARGSVIRRMMDGDHNRQWLELRNKIAVHGVNFNMALMNASLQETARVFDALGLVIDKLDLPALDDDDANADSGAKG